MCVFKVRNSIAVFELMNAGGQFCPSLRCLVNVVKSSSSWLLRPCGIVWAVSMSEDGSACECIMNLDVFAGLRGCRANPGSSSSIKVVVSIGVVAVLEEVVC